MWVNYIIKDFCQLAVSCFLLWPNPVVQPQVLTPDFMNNLQTVLPGKQDITCLSKCYEVAKILC